MLTLLTLIMQEFVEMRHLVITASCAEESSGQSQQHHNDKNLTKNMKILFSTFPQDIEDWVRVNSRHWARINVNATISSGGAVSRWRLRSNNTQSLHW